MNTATTRAQLLATSMITGVALLASTSAFAQAGAAGPVPGASPVAKPDASGGSSGSTVQELVVTGSRIPQPNLTSVSPLTTVTSAEVKLSGTTNIESLLNDLPSAFAGQTQGQSNGSDGTATVDLRGIGAKRTLVLVDGKRLMPGDPGAVVADINDIPSAMVDRIDVVTGGASAVYGSDAVAGVVNFIMKKNFEGVQVDYQYSFDNHQQGNKDGQQALNLKGYSIPADQNAGGGIHQVSVIIGANSPDDKGNITAYATYQHVDAILQSQRDFSYCGFSTSGATNNTHVCAGSSNSAFGRFDATPGSGTRIDNPNGTKTFVPYTTAQAYNFNPLNFLQREDDRYTAGFFAHYDINKAAEVYSDFMFTDDQTNAQIAPSGLFRNSGPNLSTGYTINCNNPLLGATQAAALCPGVVITPGAPGGALRNLQSIGYRFAAVPRNSDITHTDYKIDVGMRGDLGDGWTYDAYMQLGIARLDSHITGYGSVNKIANALNVIYAPGTTTPVCVNGGAACVPLDIFAANSANITQAAYNYVLASAFTTGEVRQQIASGSVTGDLGHYGIKSPFAADGVGVSVGAEYRRDSLVQSFDTEQQQGDLSGGGGQALDVAGSTNVKEVFGELQVPIAHDMPFIQDLTANAGYRYSHYNMAGDTNTYKFGAEYRPIQDVLLRASYNRAVRAPNVQELFAPNVTGLSGYVDPCGVPEKGGPPVASQAACLNTGLTAAEYGVTTVCPASQCDIRTGGGAVTGLRPEVADTYSFGGVVQPHFLPGLSVSVDYFHIKVSNVIQAGVASPTTILAQCLASAASPYCALIHRNPLDGDLFSNAGFIYQTEANAGYLATDGIDIAANYRYHLPDWYRGASLGSLDLSFVGTWLDHLTTNPTATSPATYDCAGLYGLTCGTPNPKFRSETRITWNTPWKLTASLRWRYFGPVNLDALNANPLLNSIAVDTIEGHLHSYNYFDLSFTYKVRDNLALRAGANNIFDLDPPTIDSNAFGISSPTNFGNGNTYPGVYDSLGRNIFVGFTANF